MHAPPSRTASASDAQVRSAQALLDVATKDFERQKQLYDKQYISQAALERAESQFKATQAQAAALQAQAGAARTQSGFHVVRAPYAGVVAEVPVAQGDMAMPGRALLSLYEPGALRVTAAVPQGALAAQPKGVRVEFPQLREPQRWLDAARCRCCPRSTRRPTPRSCASRCRPAWPAWPPACSRGYGCRRRASPPGRLFVPASAVVRRAEMTGVYVVDAKGAPLLRQVRLGRPAGDRSRC